MDAPKIQISQLLSETTKDCDNIIITVLCLSVTKKIPGFPSQLLPFRHNFEPKIQSFNTLFSPAHFRSVFYIPVAYVLSPAFQTC